MIVTVIVKHSNNSTSTASNVSLNLSLAHLSTAGVSYNLTCSSPVSGVGWNGHHLTFNCASLDLDEMIVCNYASPLLSTVRAGIVRWSVEVTFYSAESDGRHYLRSDSHDIEIASIDAGNVVVSQVSSSDDSLFSPSDVQASFSTAGLAVSNNQSLKQNFILRSPEISFKLGFLIQLSSVNSSVFVSDISITHGRAIDSNLIVTATNLNAGVVRLYVADVSVNPGFAAGEREVNVSIIFYIRSEIPNDAIEYVVLLDSGLDSASNITYNQSITITSPILVMSVVQVGGHNADAGDIISFRVQTWHDLLSNGPAVNPTLRLSCNPDRLRAVNDTASQYVGHDANQRTAVSPYSLDDYVGLSLLFNSTWTFNVSLRMIDDVRPGENITVRAFLLYSDAGISVLMGTMS